MAFEIITTLGQSAPPNLLFTCTSDDVDGWKAETLTLPLSGSHVLNRRELLLMSLRAVNAAATVQIIETERCSSFFFVSRGGQVVTPHIAAPIYLMGQSPGGDSETLPMCQWVKPLPFSLRAGDVITVLVPGDADGTPTQDWQLDVLFGRELSR